MHTACCLGTLFRRDGAAHRPAAATTEKITVSQFPLPFGRRIRLLGDRLRARGLLCVTAESCTGGLIGGALTAVPGSSDWFAGGVISYADEVKIRLLGVDPASLATHGAVSEAVVRQMAAGVCRALGASVAVAVSGIAGPGGGTPEKPVGTVWFGFAVEGAVTARRLHLPGDRGAVRRAAAEAAVTGLLERLNQGRPS